MTAVKTELDLLWPCVAFLVLSGTARAYDMHRYKSRRSALTADEAARWEVRYQIGATSLCRRARGMVHGGSASAATMLWPT